MGRGMRFKKHSACLTQSYKVSRSDCLMVHKDMYKDLKEITT